MKPFLKIIFFIMLIINIVFTIVYMVEDLRIPPNYGTELALYLIGIVLCEEN